MALHQMLPSDDVIGRPYMTRWRMEDCRVRGPDWEVRKRISKVEQFACALNEITIRAARSSYRRPQR